jgi:predicted cupin superfamily sugar epimerase
MMDNMDAAAVIGQWELIPHPEGGYYRETYRSPLMTTPTGWPGQRSLATAILYLLGPDEQSRRHRVRGDELWLWQGGGPMAVRIDETTHLVGPERRSGQELQTLVPGGAWQSATPASHDWSLVACIVTPGFDFADFELE